MRFAPGARAYLALSVLVLCLGSLSLAGCRHRAVCGDLVCSVGETAASCAIDCSTACDNNGICSGSETAGGCPGDCSCGDGFCGLDEDMTSCAADCGGGPACGDG